MSGSEAPSVLIIGAGPTGLTLGIELARYGIPCRLVEQSPEPATTSRAIALHVRTLELFSRMGVLEPILAEANHVRGAAVYANGRPLLDVSFEELDTPYPFAAGIAQADTERILAEHLDGLGVQVEWGVALDGLQQDDGGVTATLRHADGRSETVRSQYLVGCDGAHSVARKALGLSFEGSPYPEAFVTADCQIDWPLDSEHLRLFFHPAGSLGCFPLGGQRYRLVVTVADAAGDLAHPSAPPFEEVQRLFAERSAEPAVLSNPVWIAAFRVHHRMVDRYRKGRAFVAGDAAHIHSPAGGQGLNTSVQDAINLAWKLALVLRGAPESLLDSYGAERMPVARDVLTFTDRMTAAATVQNPLLQKLRNTVLPVLSSLGPVQQRMMTSVAMLNIQYRHSPIVEQVGHTPGPHAGDRAPDLRLSDGTTLYQELDPTRHTLLLFSGDEPDSDAARQALMLAAECEHLLRTLVVRRQSGGAGSTLPDPDGEIHRQYAARAGTLCLVRPDGYLGFRGEAGDVERLRRYLERVFGPGR